MAPQGESRANSPTLGDLFKQLPAPVIDLVTNGHDFFKTSLGIQSLQLLAKLAEYSIIYFICYFGFGFGWVLILTIALHFQSILGQDSELRARLGGVQVSNEVHYELTDLPACVAFPDHDRVEFLNEIIKQLWTHIDGYATYFLRTFIEPKIKEVLDRMNLQQASRFSIKRIMLGSSPLRIGGIKVYEKRLDHIVLDCDLAFSGDARVQFSLQGIPAEINKITFRGKARLVIKPLLNTFPFIGGFEVFFLSMPNIHYSLGGIGTFGDLPGVSIIVKQVVMNEIRSRFVWPNRLHFHLPIDADVTDSSSDASDKSYMMRRPTGLLTVHITEGMDLVIKDKHVLGSGKSDPYAIVSVGERKFNFRSKYVAKTVNPKWDYVATFLMEEWHGHELLVEIYDHDKADSDDFMGRVAIKMESAIEQKLPQWLDLSDVKHGKIKMDVRWQETREVTSDDSVADKYIISVLVESCTQLVESDCEASTYPRVRVTLNDLVEQTAIKNKTGNPVYEESFLFETCNLSTDKIILEVVDSKKNNASLGKAILPIEDIVLSPSREIISGSFDLGSNAAASVQLSAKLYCFRN